MAKLCNLTVPELDKIRTLANFTDDEMDYFNMKSKDYSNVMIAMEMCISESKVSRLARTVKTKIKKVL